MLFIARRYRLLLVAVCESHWFYSEGNDASTDLDCLRLINVQLNGLLGKDQGPKLREIVLKVKTMFVGVIFQDGVASAD